MESDMTTTIIRCILVLFVLPFLMGNGILGIIKEEKSIAKAYVFGWFTFWAAGQILLVPMILAKVAFSDAILVWSAFAGLLALCGLFTTKWPKLPNFPKTWPERFAIFVTFLTICIFFALIICLQHTDDDDSRFVVNAVDMLRTNTMFLTNPATGLSVSRFVGELCKDVVAPWAVFIAWCAKLCELHPTIMAHSILPIVLYFTSFCIWWLLANYTLHEDTIHKCIFLCLIIFISVYGYYSKRSSESFFILRIWQGKADIAGLGIPLALWCLMQSFETNGKPQILFLLLIIHLSMCFMSSMGIIIGIILLTCFGLIHGLSRCNLKLSFIYWCLCIPSAIYYIIYQAIIAQ